ncbi:MAG: ribosome-associated translation inhibitor RaiA [Bdellovibrionaceae bacterium]|jgi:putative sigma-54 modulation protein|nr:ribosome-associated translation inhibitor RaiA [Pseudobdellovibrionaceae bacterium]
MNLTISFRHMDSTPSLEEKIKDKAGHLKKYFKGKVDIEWVCSVEGEGHLSKIAVHAGKNYFHAEAADENLYKTFDQALSKVERQIRKKHAQLKDHLHSA